MAEGASASSASSGGGGVGKYAKFITAGVTAITAFGVDAGLDANPGWVLFVSFLGAAAVYLVPNSES